MKRNTVIGLAVLALAWLASALLFEPTWATLVAKWMDDNTYTHGFLILPICLWLIWQRRVTVSAMPATPFWPALAVVIGVGALWMVGELAAVNSVQQFAVVAMLPALALLVLGWRLSWKLVIPLAFLFLMVPFGKFLEPPMMEGTASFVIGALRLSGIPVYREGLFFTLPTGRWSVVEACSGLRYLIAAVVLGIIYAYITYRTLRKRVLFLAAVVAFAVFGNWLRALMIVMLGHLSGMSLGVGIDHLFFGWVFFGVVIGVIFAIGARWRDPDPFGLLPAGTQSEATLESRDHNMESSSARLATVTLLGVLALAMWLPVTSSILGATTVRDVAPAIRSALNLVQGSDWSAHYLGAKQEITGRLGDGPDAIDVQVAYYARQQEPDAEMIAYGNDIVWGRESAWHQVRSSASAVGALPLRETELASSLGRRLVWSWYVIDGQPVTSDALGKLRTLWSLLRGHGDHAAFVALSVPIGVGADAVPTARGQLALQAPLVAKAVTAALAPR